MVVAEKSGSSIFHKWSRGQEAGNGKWREDREKEDAEGVLIALKDGRQKQEEETSMEEGGKLSGLI